MNIQILDSWLRDHLKTKATPKQIASMLSLSSVSVERLEKQKNDWLYDIEVTTNRPDLMSVVGLARETATVLNANRIEASFKSPQLPLVKTASRRTGDVIVINNDPKLVHRVCAVVMEVKVKNSPAIIKDRLEATGIRSLNNLIDVTNYVMRVIGHPTHVFDFDRLNTKTLTIRESKAGEKILTLDKKSHTLPGGDIVATNDAGEIVDLLGIMGLENSVVTNDTKRILFFIDNNEPTHMRKTSMTLSIRSEAVVLNEKAIDPELAIDALLYGIALFEEIADGKVVSPIVDIYPKKVVVKEITVSEKQINTVIGVQIPLKKSAEILKGLGFAVTIHNDSLTATPPTFRAHDMEIPEDLIEEIARIYGYHNIPSLLPPLIDKPSNIYDALYWENRTKNALKYWGFTEVYTYPMIGKELYHGDIKDAITIANPLSEDMVYMRNTLVPSLLEVTKKNKNHDSIQIFELANVYIPRHHDLPNEQPVLAGVVKKPRASFYEVKGVIEQLLQDLGITDLVWTPDTTDNSAVVHHNKEELGKIRILEKHVIVFSLDFAKVLEHATSTKKYQPLSKYPALVEDLSVVASGHVLTGDIIETIQKQNALIREVTLIDKYKDTRTFHIVYQSYQKNLTNQDIIPIREKVAQALHTKFSATIK